MIDLSSVSGGRECGCEELMLLTHHLAATFIATIPQMGLRTPPSRLKGRQKALCHSHGFLRDKEAARKA
jgi:hypothetical protein